MPTSWSTDSDEVVIGVVGVTGSGKSSFIKLVTQSRVINTSGGPESDTQEIDQYRFQSGGTRYVLVDTPGFDDSMRDDEDVYLQLARWTAKSFRAGQYMNGLLYLHPVTTSRHRGSAIRNLHMFKKLCGNNNFGNVVLGLTFCDIESEDNIRCRQEELSSTPEWWGDMIALGSRVERIPHQRDACIQILSQLSPRRKVALKIQEEVVMQGRDINQTDAAKTIAHKEELNRIRAQEARQFAELRAGYERQMTQARNTYEITLRIAQQRFEATYQRQQMQEQAFTQSNKRQEELSRRVRALHAENEAQRQVKDREIARLQEQLRQIRLGNEKGRGEAEFSKALPLILIRRRQIDAEWKVMQERKYAWRLKQLYKAYAADGESKETTMNSFVGIFCDRCFKSYSACEDFFSCRKCVELGREIKDEQTGVTLPLVVFVCRSCKDNEKGCFYHGQQELQIESKWKIDALENCPRYTTPTDILYCDKCAKDIVEDGLFLHCCACDENWDLCINCWGKGATCRNKHHDLHVISHCPPRLRQTT